MVLVTADFKPSRWEPPSLVRMPFAKPGACVMCVRMDYGVCVCVCICMFVCMNMRVYMLIYEMRLKNYIYDVYVYI